MPNDPVGASREAAIGNAISEEAFVAIARTKLIVAYHLLELLLGPSDGPRSVFAVQVIAEAYKALAEAVDGALLGAAVDPAWAEMYSRWQELYREAAQPWRRPGAHTPPQEKPPRLKP